MSHLLNTNVETYKAIARDAHGKMQEYIASGRKPKSDGSEGWIISVDPERNSLKQAFVTIVFASIWLTAILHLKIVRKNGAQRAKKHDRDFSYKEGLEILGCNEEAILDAVERLRKCRKELVHEKAFHDSGEIKIAENEADNAYWLIVAIEKYFETASNPPIPD